MLKSSNPKTTAPERDLSTLTASKIFDELLPQALAVNPEKAKAEAKKVKASVKFDISGELGGVWTVDAKSETPHVRKDDASKADVTIYITGHEFADLVLGGIEAALKLVLLRRVKIRGNAYKATKIGAIFGLIEDQGVEQDEAPDLKDMSPPRRFMEYAMAFEESMASDDWSFIKEHMTEDIVYDTNYGPMFGVPHPQGWSNVERWFRTIANAADRQGIRAGELYSPPVQVPITDVPHYDVWNDELPDEVVRIGWVAFYDVEGAPTCTIYGLEWALYRKDKIFLLRDYVPESSFAEVQEWLDNYGHLINWNPMELLAEFKDHERYEIIKKAFEEQLNDDYKERAKIFEKESIYPEGSELGIMADQEKM